MKTCSRCGGAFEEETKRQLICVPCRRPPSSRPLNPELTLREKQVIAAVAQGKRNRDIAAALLLRESTVKIYLVRIFKKLKVKNRTDLAVYWERRQPEAHTTI